MRFKIPSHSLLLFKIAKPHWPGVHPTPKDASSGTSKALGNQKENCIYFSNVTHLSFIHATLTLERQITGLEFSFQIILIYTFEDISPLFFFLFSNVAIANSDVL